MEERTCLQPNQLLVAAEAVTESSPPSQAPRAPSGGGGDDAPAAPLFSSSSSSDDEGPGGDFEFEFPFVSRDSPAGTAAPADELFADGRIRPAPFYYYPSVFGHLGVGSAFLGGAAAPVAPPAPPRVRGQLGRLFLEESRTSSVSSTASSTDDEGLEGAAPESYCLWTPSGSSTSSPRARPPPRKSSSTGSVARWRRISELVVGRSHSDGKEKFIFFPAPAPPPQQHKAAAEAGNTSKRHDRINRSKPKPRKVAAAEVDTAHRIAYGGGTPRRTFLPYREELVGFFANVNGVSRSHQNPF